MPQRGLRDCQYSIRRNLELRTRRRPQYWGGCETADVPAVAVGREDGAAAESGVGCGAVVVFWSNAETSCVPVSFPTACKLRS
jgi:hypothetical protein